MKTLMFYSYKGGSGRTVAAANVAAALARLGRKVAIIDLDFEAPGLQHVFNAEGTAQFKTGNGIQHYLKEEIELHDLFNDATIDLFAQDAPLYWFNTPGCGLFLYIMASTKVTRIDAQDPKVTVRLKRLIDVLRNKHGIDFVVIDAASGFRDTYSIAADVSDEMLIFFRWSKQHVEGTLRTVKYLSRLKDYDQAWVPFKLIASASPREEEIEEIEDENTRRSLSRIKRETQTRIEDTLKECQVTPTQIYHEIPELLELKWRETIIGDENSPYEALARLLAQPQD